MSSFQNIMTHYEYTTIRGIRAKQLNEGMPPFVPVSPADTPFDIFEKELAAKKIPFIITRKLNSDEIVKVKVSDLKVISHRKM